MALALGPPSRNTPEAHVALKYFQAALLAAPLVLGCGVSEMHSFEDTEASLAGSGSTSGGGGAAGSTAPGVPLPPAAPTGTATPTPATPGAPSTPSTPSPEPVDPGPECTEPQTRSCTTSCGSTGTQRCQDVLWGDCERPPEQCSNGVDDDCDGRVDRNDPECPPITFTCEDEEGGGCNGDPGYGDHCAPADNTGGCSPARFNAWCNRRNPATPNIWYDWIITWVDSRCDGAVTHDNAQYTTYACLDSSNRQYECTTPLVLQFAGAPVRLEASTSRFAFTPGQPVETDWPTAATPWLVRDIDGDGRIGSGRELFGGDTLLPSGRVARHGFEALAALDENHDGVLDARDPAFASLRTWRDDGDRVNQPAELRTLAQEGVTALALGFRVEPRCDGRGNCERERGLFTFLRDGEVQRGALVDVHLRVGSLPLAVRSTPSARP